MDYVPGVSLHYLLQQNGPVPVAEACELVRQAALGLEYIHQQNLVHRDIKPSNLMLTPEGVVKILDLGLARSARRRFRRRDHPRRRGALGTGDYLAPEQAVDSRQVDIRADIYSLGCTLFKLLCGSAPFGGERFSSFAEKVRAHREEPFPDLPEGFPADLNLVLRAMTAKDPNLRHADPRARRRSPGPLATRGAPGAFAQGTEPDAGAPPRSIRPCWCRARRRVPLPRNCTRCAHGCRRGPGCGERVASAPWWWPP